MASFNASSSCGSRHNADASIEYEVSQHDITMDRAIYASTDGLCLTQEAVNITAKRRRIDPASLEDDDDLRNWMPGRDTGEAWNTPQDAEEAAHIDPTTGKRKYYASSDNPNKVWRELLQAFLDATLWNEGLGDAMGDLVCGCCPRPAKQEPATDTPPLLQPEETSTASPPCVPCPCSACGCGAGTRAAPASPAEPPMYAPPQRFFRCADCGMFVQCEDCVVQRHALQPLHNVKEWTGEFWDDVTLVSLGLVYQLGHRGLSCPVPHDVLRRMVVIHTNGIHTIHYRYCGCDLSDRASNLDQLLRNAWYPATTVDPATCTTFEALKLYRLLNVVGNLNVHDFVGTLEHRTDPTKIKPIPDRYKAVEKMTRQYTFLKQAKRAGVGNAASGLKGTAKGGMAVLCWACPQDGINLPKGWRDVDPEFRFLYMLLLAVDVNFRLRNRIRKNEIDNASFGPGLGCLVDYEPYREHLKGYIAEKDISICIVFAALLQKDTWMTTGLCCSGVGGVICARHELVRPQGMGDLQKGERYSNMDYIVLSSILGLSLVWLTISYDIACQWQINLKSRMDKMPAALKIPASVEIQFGLPVWHAAAHEKECQAKNSLNYLEGVGRTDGGGIERTWSGLNPLGWATKEMGQGARHDMMHWKTGLITTTGRRTLAKLIIAIEERDVQVAVFTDVDSTLAPQVRNAWQKKVDDWLGDKSNPNLYERVGGLKGGPSEVTVCLDLKKDEVKEAQEGAANVHRTGTTAFLVAGMQLEETQRRIKAEQKERVILVADQSNRVEELRLSFMSKLKTFRDLQARHMPGATEMLESEEEEQDAESRRYCAMDAKPIAYGYGAHSWIHVVGQRQSLRSNTLIGQVNKRIDTLTTKYRRAWKALRVLKGEEWCEKKRLRELTAADLTLEEEFESDVMAWQKLARAGSSSTRKNKNKPTIPKKGKSKKKFSWIWTARGGPGEDQEELLDCVRVDWSKVLARKVRWSEEVRLLREEMRWVMRFLRWRAAWWDNQRDVHGVEMEPELRAGLNAYAARQAELHRRIAARFKTAWDTSASGLVRIASQEDAMAMLEEGMLVFMRETSLEVEEQ
ncbi:hypothetical protein C8R43DRAFT_1120404 [Mycena crocata]|nr:hypothetical protein C8R43DRAFT_1120404 [Mycena crocata]